MIFRTLFFLVINFGALALGALLMGGSPAENEWYNSLNKAPWTPPGWVFGFAWTIIMICYSLYMARVFVEFKGKLLRQLMILFALQFITNVLWNPLFFNWHLVFPALLVLTLLVVILVIVHLNFSGWRKFNNFLIAPYLLWLLIAFSLNLYVLILN
jgi:tryptophan-rich sensory protein